MIQRMSQREKLLVGSALVFVLLVAIWLGLVKPYQKSMQRLEQKISVQKKSLAQAYQLQAKIESLRRQIAAGASRGNDNSPLVSQVESLTDRSGLRENLLSMRPQQAAVQGKYRQQLVEIRLERLSLEQLVRFLYAVETSGRGIQVKALRAKPRFEDRSSLDVNLTLYTLERQS